MAGISKAKTEAMQAWAMERLEIRPFPDEVEEMITTTVNDIGFDTRADAYSYLLKTGLLTGKDVGGEALNSEEVVVGMVKEFGTTRETARKHVARAARRKRHPDAQWQDKRGGEREGAGRKRKYVIDVRNGRCIISQQLKVGDNYVLSAAANWEELEEKSALIVQAQGGSVTMSGQYICPTWLVETAVWDNEEE